MAKKDKLTIKQKKFCDQFIVTGNATQAVIEAGYKAKDPAKYGYLLRHDPKLKKYIDDRLEVLDEEAIADQKEVLRYLTAVMRKESVSEEVMMEGVEPGITKPVTISRHPTESEALRAAELLGKRYGLFVNTIKNEGAVTVDIGEWSDGD